MSKSILSDVDIEDIIRRDYRIRKSCTFTILKESDSFKTFLEKVPLFSLKEDLKEKFEHSVPYLWIPVVVETDKEIGDDSRLQVTFFEFNTRTNNIKKHSKVDFE